MPARGLLGPDAELRRFSVPTRRQALSLLATAYGLLLANHGQLTSMTKRQKADALGLGSDSRFDPEFSSQCGGRFAEAQIYVRQALELLGVRVQPREGLQLVSRAESLYDGLISDLAAVRVDQANLADNTRLAGEVAGTYDAIRRSAPELGGVRPLATLEDDVPKTALERLYGVITPYWGDPRFWSTSRWILMALPFAGIVAWAVIVWFLH